MRILLVSHQLDYSGAPIALLRLANVLVEAGHEVRLVTLKPGPLAADFAAAGVQPLGARDSEPELVVANTVMSVPAALAAAPSSDRALAWIHESMWFLQRLALTPQQLGLHALRHAAFPSRFQLDEFRAHLPWARLLQLRNHVAMDDVEPSTEPGRYLVCSGGWEARKGQARLLALLRDVDPAAQVAFLGASAPPGLERGPHRFTGQVPPQEARRIIAASAGVVSAAVAETQNLAAIEAMLALRPVLLSDIPAHRELREAISGVILFDPDDRDSFARGYRAWRGLWDDPDARRRLRDDAERAFGRDAFRAGVQAVLDGMHVAG